MNTNFQTIHQFGNTISQIVRQATGRDSVENIEMDWVSVEQNGKYVTREVTGNEVSFITNIVYPMKVIAEIVPVQEGTGDPSPTNVRAISGWTEANVVRTEKNYEISFPNEAGNVYGGTLTVNEDGTGTLVVDTGYTTVNDNDWEYESSYTRFKTTISGIYRPGSQRKTPFICSAFISIDDGRSLADVPDNAIYAAGTSNAVYIKNLTYTDATEFKTEFADVQIVYPLDTPVTYNLTELEVIDTLAGLNTVWADTGKVSVIYTTREDII